MSCQTTKEALRRRMVSLQRWDAPRLSLPRRKVQDFFEANNGQRVLDLANCTCGVFRGCPSRHHRPFDGTVIRQIMDPENPYIVVLGFLCYVEHTGVIHRFLEGKYSDKWLHENELSRAQLDELFGSPESGGKADSHIEFDIQLFFMPIVHGPAEQQYFSPMRTLPYTIVNKIGGGGYGNVYSAEVLDGGYFPFPGDAEDRLVAIKHYTCTAAYNAKADWEKEWRNNLMYEHQHIVPILASIAQGEVYMNFYPLCDHDLHTLFQKNPRPEHDPKSVWRQFMRLLSALRHVHCGHPNQFGYHFDIKCQNILVRKGKWMIADLGIAHSKSQGIGTSLTGRRPGPEEFGGPESTVTRKFDIWGIACVGCIAFAWLLDGASGVAQFREDRKVEISESNMPTSTLYNFFRRVGPDAVVHPAVEALLSKADDPISKGVAAVLKDMLSIDVEMRPTAEEAEKRFGKVLDVEPLALQLPKVSVIRPAQLLVPINEIPVPLRQQHSRASSIGSEVVVVEYPAGKGRQLPGGELPGANPQPSPPPPGSSNGASPITTAELVVVPDGDSGSDCEPPDGADDQDLVLLIPGSWPCGAGLDSDCDPDGSELVAAPSLPAPLQPSLPAGLAGGMLQVLGSLSMAGNRVWRRAATAGSAELHGAPKTVGVVGMAENPAGELGGGVSGL